MLPSVAVDNAETASQSSSNLASTSVTAPPSEANGDAPIFPLLHNNAEDDTVPLKAAVYLKLSVSDGFMDEYSGPGELHVAGDTNTILFRLNTLRIATLADDRGYFLPYNAALTVRRDVLDRAPRLALLARDLAPRLTDTVMRTLNERVSVGRRDPDEVARAYLHEQGLIG